MLLSLLISAVHSSDGDHAAWTSHSPDLHISMRRSIHRPSQAVQTLTSDYISLSLAMDAMDMVPGEESFGDADPELLDAAGVLAGVGGILTGRSQSSNDIDMDGQTDALLLAMQQRGGPRFGTTLVATGEPIDQRTFMR